MEISSRFDDALKFAAQLHRDQKRKATTTPYISHLLSVAAMVMEFGGDEGQAISALLHDAIEDQAGSFGGADKLRAEIEGRYGPRVVAIVDACTDAAMTPKRPWEERKRAFVARIVDMPPEAALVSICDKLHNARSIVVDYITIGDPVFERFNAGKAGTLWYLDLVAKSFVVYHRQPASKELDRVVTDLLALTGPKASSTELQETHERPPFMPGDNYEEWDLPPDSAGAEVKLFENKTTNKFWLKYGPYPFGTLNDIDPTEVIWGELTLDEALDVSSNAANKMLRERRVLMDRVGTLTVRPVLKAGSAGIH